MFTLEQNVIGVLVGGHRRIAVHAHLEFRKFLAVCLEVLCVGRKFHDFGFGVKGSVALAPAAASWISAATASGCETVHGVAALDLYHRGARPFGHGTLGVRWDRLVFVGDD